MQKSLLDSEEAALKELEKQYAQALKEIQEKVKLFQADIDLLDQALSQDGMDEATKAMLKSRKQSKIYQQQYQKALQDQVGSILNKMHGDNYTTIDKYLKDCYESGYIGTMYNIANQGIPIITPIDQSAVVKAVLTDSKVSNGLYNALGVDVAKLKKTITQEISRGIATGMGYGDMARNISNASKAPMSRTKTIARTEGHRIQQTSTADAQAAAKDKGADVLKQWDAALDGRTRDSHRRVDGEIRELDEKFSNGLMFPGDPNGGAAEVVNCRCTSDTRARWALDESELEELKQRASYFGLDKTENFKEFEEKYLKAANKIQSGGQVKDAWQRMEIKEKQAVKAYDKIKGTNDVAAIAKASGMSGKDIETIKNHIFFDMHELYDGKGTFFPSYDMAVAWKRLTDGVPEERDLLLLQHELLESQLEKEYNLTASEAHARTKKKYNWEQVIFDLFGEEGEPDGLL